MSSYNLCKIVRFQTRVAQKLFNATGTNHTVSIFRTDSFFSSIRNRIAHAEEALLLGQAGTLLEVTEGDISFLGIEKFCLHSRILSNISSTNERVWPHFQTPRWTVVHRRKFRQTRSIVDDTAGHATTTTLFVLSYKLN